MERILIWTLSPFNLCTHTYSRSTFQSLELNEDVKTTQGSYENVVLRAPSIFRSTAAEDVCLHLALLCDWLAGYRAEQRASQVSGEVGKQGFFLVGCAVKRQEGMET